MYYIMCKCCVFIKYLLFIEYFQQDKSKDLDVLISYFEHLSRKHWSWTPTTAEYQELKTLLKGDPILVNNTTAEIHEIQPRKHKKRNSPDQRKPRLHDISNHNYNLRSRKKKDFSK